MAGPFKQVRFASRTIIHSPPLSPVGAGANAGFQRFRVGGAGVGAVSTGVLGSGTGAIGAVKTTDINSLNQSTRSASNGSGALQIQGLGPPPSPFRKGLLKSPGVGYAPIQAYPYPYAYSYAYGCPPLSLPAVAPIIPMTNDIGYSSIPMSASRSVSTPASTPKSKSSSPPRSLPIPISNPLANPKPTLHPLLTDTRSMIQWDMREYPIQLGTPYDPNAVFWSEPATYPPARLVVIQSVYLPGIRIVVRTRATASSCTPSSSSVSTPLNTYVSLFEVLHAVYTSLRVNLTEKEWVGMSEKDQRRAFDAYEGRWKRVGRGSSRYELDKTRRYNVSGQHGKLVYDSDPDRGEAERQAGMKRVDMLLGHVKFAGLVPSDDPPKNGEQEWYLCVR